MGVRHLADFVVRKQRKLQDCTKDSGKRLVIDGNNLHHLLFNNSNYLHKARHGGDLDLYAAEVDRFFSALERLGITSYLLLDGFDRQSSAVRDKRVGKLLAEIDDLINGKGSRAKLPCNAKRVGSIAFCPEIFSGIRS